MTSPLPTPTAPASPRKPHSQAWHRPTISPEHGVYVMLLVSFLTGAAAALDWNWATTLAFICAFCGFQAEHPIVVQIKQRSSLKPRLLLWGGVYGGVALTLALYLDWQQGKWLSPLLWVYGGAIAALSSDAISVLHREQKSIWNEIITFTGVCLATPLAYVTTTGTISTSVLGLWLLNSLFFSSAIFTVKFRKHKQHPVMPSLIYHAIASLLVGGLWLIHWLSPMTAVTFGIVLLKFFFILWKKDWYCTTKIQSVALLETGTALIFLLAVVLTVVPAHLPSPV